MSKTNLKAFSRPELQDWVAGLGEKKFRADQLWQWMYLRGVARFEDMTNLSKDWRAELDRIAEIYSLALVDQIRSEQSGVRRFLWELSDGARIESVFIPDGNRRTVCVSTQAGCGLACAFCATGRIGFKRNLEPYEITDQVLSLRRVIGLPLTHIVLMGMGEPLLNYDNVMKALDVIRDGDGVAIGPKRITISTSGIAPAIRRFAAEKRPYRMAISLNATTDEVRSRIMPINRKHPIAELLDAARLYSHTMRERLTFEYVLIEGVNDGPEDAERLLKLLRGIRAKVNLIPYNPTSDQFKRPSDARVQAFENRIKPLVAAPVTLRESRGNDIRAACGQLAGKA
jgi:23S rRNA (adenine2503-C2)-methyltransferase